MQAVKDMACGAVPRNRMGRIVLEPISYGSSELEHSHRFVEFAPMYASICEYSDYQKNWYQC